MVFKFKVWKIEVGIHLLDTDFSDGTIMIGVSFVIGSTAF